MNVNFTARQSDLTPDIKAYCLKRLEGMRRLRFSILEVDVILTVRKNRHIAEVNLKTKGGSIVVEEETSDMMDSLNLAFDALEKKIKKDIGKNREKRRRSGRERKGFSAVIEEAVPDEKAEGTVVRVLRSPYYSLKPMTVEEALIQFDVKKREVLMFRRTADERWAVLFRRKDGHYGLVEPD
jgi:putative sigma-54 modulation protein